MTNRLPGAYVRRTEFGYDLVSPSSGIFVSVTDGRDNLRYKVVSPENAAADPIVFETNDWSEACSIYSQAWVTWAAAEIGAGFHPDNPADDYYPKLPKPLRAEYDAMIDFASGCLDDIYAVGLEAMQRLEGASPSVLS